MKSYTRISAAIVLTAICLLLRPTKSTTQRVITEEEGKHYTWLGHRLDEAYSIQVGMSRADLLKVFEPDGGLQRIPPRRYILRSCYMIKVDAQFELPQGTSSANLPSDKELKIFAISKPYLERAIPD
jgi:hypothetical protein